MTEVYFRMLGPLLVESDGAPVVIGGARQRALLGLLLLHRGMALSRDRLLAELWGADDASTAKRLHMAVVRLRKALGPDVGPRLVTDAAGRYRLVLGPEELDVVRFERLLSDGRASLAASDVASASKSLHEALSLWRGNALEDVADALPAQSELVRLEELRLEALEECIDADLGLGRHAELVPDLERLVEEHPSREHLLEQLMLALYRSGRQRDALAVYRRTSERLGDEFGLTPGPALRTLERAVLDHAPGLGAPTEPELVVPRPSKSASLIGRDAAMRELAARLTSDARLLTLLGPPGIGKTRLALTVADVVRHQYRDGVYVVPLASVRNEAQVPEQIAERLGLTREGGGSLEQSVRTHLAGREALLVLDNFEHVLGACAFVGTLLDACPGVDILTTSREPLRLTHEHRWPVGALSMPDADVALTWDALAAAGATRLFLERARALGAEPYRTQEQMAAVVEICHRLEGVALAIELAAARTPVLSVTELASRLDSALVALGPGPRDAPPRQQTLRATLDWSHDLLGQDERRALACLAVFTGGCTVDAAETVIGVDLDVLERLAESSLLRRRPGTDGTTRLVMLEVVRQYALERFQRREDVNQVRAAHLRYYVELARAAETRMMGQDQQQWFQRLDDEAANLRAALGVARPGDIARIVADTVYWWVRLAPAEGRRWLEGALGAVRDVVDESIRGRATLALGFLVASTGDVRAGRRITEDALRIAAADGDRALNARGLIHRGFLETILGEHEAALATTTTALDRAQDPWTTAMALYAHARAVARTTSAATARPLAEQSATMLRELGDLRHAASLQCDIGYLAVLEGDIATAAPLLEDVVTLSRERCDPTMLSSALGNLGLVRLAAGDDDGAAAALREALVLFERHGFLEPASEALTALATLALRAGAVSAAARLSGAAQRLRIGEPSPMELQLQRAELAAAEEADPALWAIGRAAAERLDQHDAIACGIEPWPSTRRRDDVRSVFA